MSKQIFLRKTSLVFLQIVLVLIGIAVFTFMLWEPHLEGRNIGATLFEIYFKDPFLAYVYIGSIPFFIGLYKAFKALRRIAQNKTFSEATVQAVRTVRYCALATAGFIVGAELYLFIFQRGKDDVAGAAMLGFIATFISTVVAALVSVFEQTLQNGMNTIKDR